MRVDEVARAWQRARPPQEEENPYRFPSKITTEDSKRFVCILHFLREMKDGCYGKPDMYNCRIYKEFSPIESHSSLLSA